MSHLVNVFQIFFQDSSKHLIHSINVQEDAKLELLKIAKSVSKKIFENRTQIGIVSEKLFELNIFLSL